MAQNNWITKSSSTAFENKYLKISHNEIIRPDGSEGIYDYIDRRDYVLVIPKENEKFYLVEQYRYPVKEYSIEFPQGNLDKDEEPEKAAARELEEEIGFKAEKLEFLGKINISPGINIQKGHIFVAEGLTETERKLESSEQDMTTKESTYEELMEMVKTNQLTDAATLAAIVLYQTIYNSPANP